MSVVASGIGRGCRAERGLVSRKDVVRSRRAGFERGCIRDTARIQWALIGDRYALQSERVIFYKIIPDQAIKIGRHWSWVGQLSGVNVALPTRSSIAFTSPTYSFPWKRARARIPTKKFTYIGERGAKVSLRNKFYIQDKRIEKQKWFTAREKLYWYVLIVSEFFQDKHSIKFIFGPTLRGQVTKIQYTHTSRMMKIHNGLIENMGNIHLSRIFSERLKKRA